MLQAQQPADFVLAAHRDVLRLPPEERPYARYLAVSEPDPKMKFTCWQAASGLANGTSHRSRIVQPVVILQNGEQRHALQMPAADWSKVELIRFRTSNYGDRWGQVFDQLGNAEREPLYHVAVSTPYPAGKYRDGRSYPAGVTREQFLAPWLVEPLGLPQGWWGLVTANTYAKATVELSDMTRSPTPIVEASNYIWQAAIQFDRGKAGYYDFLGVKSKADFDRLTGFDEKASVAFALPWLEAVAVSGVATQPRRIEIYPKIGGFYVLTKDQVGQRAIGNRNPLNVLERNDLKADATEIFAQLPNGMWATALFSLVDGSRQDSAPDGVGYHHGSVTNDGKIHVNLACLACHDKVAGNGGMQPFRPYFRNLYAEPGPVALTAARKQVLKGLEEEYLAPIDLENAQRSYAKAVHRATGLTPDKYASALVEVFHAWDRPVTRPMAARMYGVSEPELVRALSVHLQQHGALNNVNAGWLLREPPAFGRDQFAESFNLGQLALRGLPTWPAEMRKRYKP